MKTRPCSTIAGMVFCPRFRATVWSVASSFAFVAGVAGLVAAPSPGDGSASASRQEPLLNKVMAELPSYGKNMPAATESKPAEEVTTETVHLAPLVITGYRGIRLRNSELLTKKAFNSEIFKRYDFSAFSLFEHREDKRLEDMADLKTYADNLVLVGDEREGRTIRKESSRLFLRPHDPESEYMVSIFNPRIR